MSIVQFRWKDNDGNIRILDQSMINWVFKEGDTFEFWGGTNKVLDVKVILEASFECRLDVTQIVTIEPLWNNPELHITPEEVWKDRQILGIDYFEDEDDEDDDEDGDWGEDGDEYC